MKKRFIVLIDFSSYSKDLLMYAADWCRSIAAELVLVHKTFVMSPALVDTESKQAMALAAREEAAYKLEAFAKELVPPGTVFSVEVTDGPLEKFLQALLSQPFEHLLFVGLKGTGIIKQLFIGSVALDVIEHTNEVVVAIPRHINRFSHEKLMIAVSDKHAFNVLALNNFLQFLDNGKTRIQFFYLAQPYEKTENVEKQLNELTALFSTRFPTEYKVYEGESPFEDIRKVINNKVDEILIVQKGSRLLSDQLFRKFLINELVYEGETPLIVLPS
ncbi:MAG: universal stress protein [Flavipsychrobacter sp.]|nr:universal stress protein [Flavipsychrobacter sp.]